MRKITSGSATQRQKLSHKKALRQMRQQGET